MKRVLALLMVAAVAIGVFGGCGDDKKDNTSSAPLTDGIFSKENVIYVDSDGDAVYRIVRPDGNKDMTTLASNIYKQMKNALGTNLRNVLDSEDGTDMYEILIGNTNRPESQQALQYLRDNGQGRYNDYIICTLGKKIVINGVTDAATTAAVEYFIANFVKKEGVEGGMKHTFVTEGNFSTVTINGTNISKYKFVRDITTRSWLIQEEISKIQQSLKEKTGFIIDLADDTKTQESEYEISIGSTNRSGAGKESDYNSDEYEIKISGKKVFIMGGSTHAVQVAVTEFGKILEKGTLTDADSKIGSYNTTIENYDSGSYYRYVWGDDFNGDTLDTSKWFISSFNKPREDGKVAIGEMNENTVSIQNGNIIMRAFETENGWLESGGLMSNNKMHYHCGYIEMRSKMPDGPGVYTSFWGTGGDENFSNNSGHLEIDIFESLGNPGRHVANIHKWGNGAIDGHESLDGKVNDRDYRLTEGTLFDQYHTVGLLWTETEVHFYYDGIEYYTQSTDEFYANKYISVIAGFCVGWPDRKDPQPYQDWPLECHIDYIHLYQIDGQSFITK